MKHALTQIQYRFAVKYETLGIKGKFENSNIYFDEKSILFEHLAIDLVILTKLNHKS